MTLDELVQQGWAQHDTKTAEVADRLEEHLDLVTDADGAAKFMNLANHAVGDHLGDRARALRLCEAAVGRLPDDADTGPWLHLAVARHLAGDEAGGEQAVRKMGDDPSVAVRVGMLVAQGHMHAGDWSASMTLYDEALRTAEALPEGHGGERAAAMVSNNIASELLGIEQRSEAQDTLMERAAHASREFWVRIGDWTNDERADYLLSLVHTSLGQAAEGRRFAERGLATIAANGEEKVDEAFLHLARARACRDGGASEDHQESLARAQALAEGFENPGLLEWFQGELASAR